jgi:hypothetical protein
VDVVRLSEPHPTVHVPQAFPWPVVLVLGLMLAGFGVLTNLVFSAISVALFVWALAGWMDGLR